MTHRILARVACAALLGGCAGGQTATPQAPGMPVVVPSLTAPIKGSPIQHVIVVIQENRTVDNMFNGFPTIDTVSSGLNSHNKKVALQPEGLEWPYDPDHTHESLVKEYDDGAMNGFDKVKCDFNPFQSPCTAPANFHIRTFRPQRRRFCGCSAERLVEPDTELPIACFPIARSRHFPDTSVS